MAYNTASVMGNHVTLSTNIATKLNELTIVTLHAIQVVRISSDHFLAIIVYE